MTRDPSSGREHEQSLSMPETRLLKKGAVMKFKKDSDQWPRDSLRRTLLLNYPGCKSATEAFELARNPANKIQTPLEPTQEYKSMRQAIIDIEVLINGFDIDLMDPELRESLKSMPLKNLGDIELWKSAWTEVMTKPKKD